MRHYSGAKAGRPASATSRGVELIVHHDLNKGFQWKDSLGPYHSISEQQAEQWNSGGYFLLQQAISDEELSMLQAEIDPLEQKTNQYLRELDGRKQFIARADELTFSIHIVLKSEKVCAFVAGSLFGNLCRDLLGDDARLYWDQAVYKKPGNQEEFPWHQDNGYNFVAPQDYLTCWIPLVDATIDNGCPWVVPGVHRGGTLAHWQTDLGFQCLDQPTGAVPVEARAGDIIVFSSLTPHRTGPNLTTRDRKAYIVQYSHDGSVLIPRDGGQLVQDDVQRQFRVVHGGQLVI
jgi:phytanoyl-CoA hydroxylase